MDMLIDLLGVLADMANGLADLAGACHALITGRHAVSMVPTTSLMRWARALVWLVMSSVVWAVVRPACALRRPPRQSRDPAHRRARLQWRRSGQQIGLVGNVE